MNVKDFLKKDTMTYIEMILIVCLSFVCLTHVYQSIKLYQQSIKMPIPHQNTPHPLLETDPKDIPEQVHIPRKNIYTHQQIQKFIDTHPIFFEENQTTLEELSEKHLNQLIQHLPQKGSLYIFVHVFEENMQVKKDYELSQTRAHKIQSLISKKRPHLHIESYGLGNKYIDLLEHKDSEVEIEYVDQPPAK